MQHDCVLYATEKDGQRAKQRKDRVLLQKGYSVGNKLDCWNKYLWQLEKDNPRSYQNGHLDYLQEFKWL
jgi:hypothetical protein